MLEQVNSHTFYFVTHNWFFKTAQFTWFLFYFAWLEHFAFKACTSYLRIFYICPHHFKYFISDIYSWLFVSKNDLCVLMCVHGCVHVCTYMWKSDSDIKHLPYIDSHFFQTGFLTSDIRYWHWASSLCCQPLNSSSDNVSHWHSWMNLYWLASEL